VPDFIDVDDDGDGLPTTEEIGRDTDRDGISDYLDADDDADKITTERELADAQRFGEDVDKDNLPNYRDTDSDGDGRPDSEERGDGDSNDIPDYLEAAAASSGGGCSTAPGTNTGLPTWVLLGACLVVRRARARAR
jgi:hypothetical protein